MLAETTPNSGTYPASATTAAVNPSGGALIKKP